MRFETALLQELTAQGGAVAEVCLRWLVTGEAPPNRAMDVAWPTAD